MKRKKKVMKPEKERKRRSEDNLFVVSYKYLINEYSVNGMVA